MLQSLYGIAWWAVAIFVWLAGIELDVRQAWRQRREMPDHGRPGARACRSYSGWSSRPRWREIRGGSDHGRSTWQYVLGVGMACAVTALPVLILLLEKLSILRLPIGQRVLRYASLDDVAIWGVLALILMDLQRIGAATRVPRSPFWRLQLRLSPSDAAP